MLKLPKNSLFFLLHLPSFGPLVSIHGHETQFITNLCMWLPFQLCCMLLMELRSNAPTPDFSYQLYIIYFQMYVSASDSSEPQAHIQHWLLRIHLFISNAFKIPYSTCTDPTPPQHLLPPQMTAAPSISKQRTYPYHFSLALTTM